MWVVMKRGVEEEDVGRVCSVGESVYGGWCGCGWFGVGDGWW